MRYAIVSDIHANLQAWKAVLLDLRSMKADRVICLGDIVGYGPNPAEVLQSVYANADHLVLGNHDAVVCGKMDPALFNPAAQELIAWTKDHLGPDAMRFLGALPLTLCGDGFRCAHGEFSQPAAFDYVFQPQDAMPSWSRVDEPLLFVGHTHWPAIFVLGASGTPHRIDAQDFALEEGKRFLVSVGSVGQPRDREARAAYCLFDGDSRSVYWRRIPFDLDAYRDAVARAGLREEAAAFLRHDPRGLKAPVREGMEFAPPQDPRMAVAGAVEVQAIETLKRRVSRWRLFFGLLLLASVALACGWGWFGWTVATRKLDAGPLSPRTVEAGAFAPEHNILPAFSNLTAVSLEHDWGRVLGERRRQTVRVAEHEGVRVLALTSSSSRHALTVKSLPVRAAPGTAMRVEAYFLKSGDFRGEAACVVRLLDPASGQDREIVVNPNVRRKGGWLKAQDTFSLPAGIETVELHIRSTFVGQLLVRDIALFRKLPN